MPSPFPGMNPYFEQDVAWHDFHERFVILGAGLIGAQVGPHFIVKVDEHLYIHELAEDSHRLAGRADLALTPAPRATGPNVGLLDAPRPAR